MKKIDLTAAAFTVVLVASVFGLHSMANASAQAAQRLADKQGAAQSQQATLAIARRVEYVQITCDQWRTNNTPATVKACGDAQTITNSEYLCNSTGVSCWVEVK